MSSASPKSAPCLGFLTVVENTELGLLGGYLLLNAAGRPLEFHCTAPVKANRTQEILYGPTLKPYLYGEQIGQTLLSKSRLTPIVVCTDCEAMLAVRDFTQFPVVLTLGHIGSESLVGGTPFQLAKSRVAAATHYAGDEQTIRDSWPTQGDHLDLHEPFTRVREALDERNDRRRGKRREENAECGMRSETEMLYYVSSAELCLSVEPFEFDFASDLSSPLGTSSCSPFLAVDGKHPKSISLKIASPPPRTFSFKFPESPTISPSPPSKSRGIEPAAPSLPPCPAPLPSDKTPTRIKPPGDIIKLEDRLYYVLQPPLETLLQSDAMHFPFEPFPYQFQGVAFLYPRYSAILADEMGLGKTMQAITAVRMLIRSGELRRVLLICPKPLVTNWQRKFSMWAPEIPLAIIEGDQAKRQWQWAHADAPVRIANYELLMRDRDAIDAAAHFDLVILDEAQRIKNTSSTTSQMARSISRSRSWALTGTPIENTPDDLVGIFEFLSPGYLRPGMGPKRLSELVRDHILRRTKDMVLTDLPPKMFRDAELDLSHEQRASYEMAENEGVMRLNEMGDCLTIQHVFELVLRLKQICNFDPATGASSKLERLMADIEEVAASGKKAIIFSQWVKCLEILSHQLRRFGPLEYHGKIPSKQRDSVLKQFKEDKSKHVILMSYGAGSVGLNLQFCEYVFLFDRWWNPAVEDQAINPAHRIGAAGPVTVTRMLSLATIEERINEVLNHKRELFAQIIGENSAPASMGLSQHEIFGLFNLRSPKGAIKPAA